MLAMILVAVVVLGAVGAYYYAFRPSSEPSATTSYSKMTGKISQKGSDTLLLLAQRWAEDFMKKPEYSEVQISVSGGGSGTGIAALINGEADFADASREMKQSEIDQAKAKGVNPVEWKVAMDGITIIVNPKNPVSELTLQQLATIYEGNVTNWKDLGGNDGQIITYGRQSNSGTYVYFKEHVLQNKDYRNDVQALNGNADIAEAVARDKNGIGYVGLGYAEQNAGTVRIVNVKKDANSPAVKPSIQTVTDGSYPIARFLYIYTNGVPKDGSAAYLKFILSEEGQKIAEETGFIPLTSDITQQELAALE
jgi:phosphate transport system substrate-binding protein